jgi:serine/threonine protein kinase
MKTMKKEHIVNSDQVLHVKNEKELLLSVNNAFVVDLLKTFQNDRKIFLLMEFVPGGDLFCKLRGGVLQLVAKWVSLGR